ncbi:MAG: OmpH family outer membrane protein [Deltaproteobacteria bacterium]|nr:OmpH family outer membrane protein [Deltaproteobacteria bacterium]
MKTLRTLCVVTLGLVVGAAAWAQTASRIAYVDMMRAFSEIDEGRAGLKELERFKNDRQKLLDEKQNSVKAQMEELDRQGMLIKPEVKQQKETELRQQMLETQQMFMNMQKELSQKEMEFKMTIYRKMQVVIQEIAENQGFTLVLDSSAGGPVVYGRTADDITAEVVRTYNSRSSAAAPAKKPEGKKKKSG